MDGLRMAHYEEVLVSRFSELLIKQSFRDRSCNMWSELWWGERSTIAIDLISQR